MNHIKFLRTMLIFIGMMLINIGTQFFIRYKGVDITLMSSYFSLNTIWIFLVQGISQEIIDSTDEHLEDEVF